MKKIVVFSGAGISAESGLNTFRDSDGLWENHDIMEVATLEAWSKNPEVVINFYNQRRKEILMAEPNTAHHAIVELEKHFDVQVITQNIDNLHERSGSKNVLHLHGEINLVESSINPKLVYNINKTGLELGQNCEEGSQLRPHIVWFGEDVPNMAIAETHFKEANIIIIIGTSLSVYPAAGLVYYAKSIAPKYLIDPKAEPLKRIQNLTILQKKASDGVPTLANELIEQYSTI